MFGKRYSGMMLIAAWMAATLDPSFAGDTCSLSLLEADAARAAEICTSTLNRNDISTASRVDALKIRGRAMQRLNRYTEAVDDYEAGLKIAPDDPELHLRRGWTAFEDLRRGWQETSGHGLGPVEFRALQMAIDQADQALKLKPDYAEAYSLKQAALTLGVPARFEEAKAAADGAVRLAPDNAKFRFDRMVMLKKRRLYPEAIADADAVMALPADAITAPSATDIYMRRCSYRIATAILRAELLRAVGRMDDAEQAYDHAVELDPDPITYSRRAAFKLSPIGFSPGMPPPPFDAVQADLDKALALDPDYWASHEQQGYLLFARGQIDAAAAEFARALKQFPVNGGLRWQYALMLRRLGQEAKAADEAITAFRLDPGFMTGKLSMLRQRGYLAAFTADTDPRLALIDAVRACMLDDRCG